MCSSFLENAFTKKENTGKPADFFSVPPKRKSVGNKIYGSTRQDHLGHGGFHFSEALAPISGEPLGELVEFGCLKQKWNERIGKKMMR